MNIPWVAGQELSEYVCQENNRDLEHLSWKVSSKKHRERLLVRTMTEQAGIRRTRPQCGGRRPVFRVPDLRDDL